MDLIILWATCLSLGVLGIIFLGKSYLEWVLHDILLFEQYLLYQQKINKRFAEVPEIW